MDKIKFPPFLSEDLENPEFTFDDPKDYYNLMDRNSAFNDADYADTMDLYAKNFDPGYREPASISDAPNSFIKSKKKNIPNLFKDQGITEIPDFKDYNVEDRIKLLNSFTPPAETEVPDFKNYNFQERLNLLDNLKNKPAVTAKINSSDMEGLDPANIKPILDRQPAVLPPAPPPPTPAESEIEKLASTQIPKETKIEPPPIEEKKPEPPTTPPIEEKKPQPVETPTAATVQSAKDIEGQTANLRLLQMIMEGSSELGAGLAGVRAGYNVKPIKTEVFKDLVGGPEQGWKNRLAMEKLDPTSQSANALRQSVKEQAKSFNPNADLSYYDKMSENQLRDERKFLAELAERKITSLDRKAAFDFRAKLWQAGAEERRESRQERQDQRLALTNKKDYDMLPSRMENVGGQPMARLKNRIQQADNIFATLGVSPSELNTLSPKEIEQRLDKKQKLAVTEAAIELNALLGGSGAPAASTLQKLLLESGYKKGTDLASYFANKQFALNQGEYLKQILNIAARASAMAKERVRNTEIRFLSAKKHLADDPYVGAGFVNFLNTRGIDLDDLDADYMQKKEENKLGPDEVVRVDPKDPTKKAVFNVVTKEFVRWLD